MAFLPCNISLAAQSREPGSLTWRQDVTECSHRRGQSCLRPPRRARGNKPNFSGRCEGRDRADTDRSSLETGYGLDQKRRVADVVRLRGRAGERRHMRDENHDPAADREHDLQFAVYHLRHLRPHLSDAHPQLHSAAAERPAAVPDAQADRRCRARRSLRPVLDRLADALHVRPAYEERRRCVPQGRYRRRDVLQRERALPPGRVWGSRFRLGRCLASSA